MKKFGVFLGAAFMALLGYQVAYPKLFDSSFFPADQLVSKEPTAKLVEAPKVAVLKQTQPQAPVAAQVPVTSQPPVPKAPEPPAPPQVTPGASMGNPAKEVEDPNAFHPPVFAPLEDVVKNWTAVPKKAFPRVVKIRKTVEFVMPNGKSKVGPGGSVVALDQLGANLIVAPTENSPARTQIALNDTDFKESLAGAYEAWKLRTVALKHQQWEDLQKRLDQVKDTGPVRIVASNDKPARNGDGSYPVLLASMKAGQVTEITPGSITKWGEATQQKIGGKDYWVVVVDVTIITMFGPVPTIAEAHILNGKVEQWIYTGSRQVVP